MQLTVQDEASRKKTNAKILLIVAGVVGLGAVVLCGIVGAVAVPNLLNAVDRGKQKRTMADIRSIGTALEGYRGAKGAYPEVADPSALQAALSPEFIRAIPATDGWGRAWIVTSGSEGYRLVSTGKDGEPQGCGEGKTSRFDADICFENGRFTQWPEGRQW